jgi:two-component system alkaline phosphatase synthesis response regulator PhoP
MKRLLLVEDEAGLVFTLSDRLRREGYDVDHAGDGPAGLERASGGGFDLVILDVGLPAMSGFDVLEALRARGIDTPVLMLTARGQVSDRVAGLKLGADDYLAKPFEMAELLARIEARLRRTPPPTPAAGPSPATGLHVVGAVRVDLDRAEVYRDTGTVDLSAREFQLLRYLIEHRGETIAREELLEHVWGYKADTSTRTVDVHVAWLRQKIERNPEHPQSLVTVRGMGYKLL